MKSFLNIVAKDLLKKYGNNLSKITVVFPNKRASLFLNEELILQSGSKPVWSPQYTTISELFRLQSELVIADQIKLVCELYKHYCQITKSAETLDDFYGWGELMLSDFDDLDKNLGNADKIFQNTADLHEYDTADFLNEEQMETLKRFFKNVNEDQSSVLKQNFLKLWNNMGNIYNSFREGLCQQGLAYEGMLYRDVAENICDCTSMTSDKYVFVGFNLIQKAEQKLFEYMAQNNKAVFYWDFDKYYMKESNEAGRFIKEYQRAFPNEITEPEVFDNLSKSKDISYISASTEDIQARYISQWLTPERIKAGKRTAIVMCDEKLLPTIINCLPNEVRDVNVTTGYPLVQTHIANLIKLIFSLKLSGNSRNKGTLRLHHVNQILRHPYMRYFSDNTSSLHEYLNSKNIFYPSFEDIAVDEHFTMLFGLPTDEQQKDNKSKSLYLLNLMKYITKRIAVESNNAVKAEDEAIDTEVKTSIEHTRDMQLMQESMYRMHQIITRLINLIDSDDLNVDPITLQGLMFQIIKSTNVPFHGEPIVGIQVMGILETRNLDFDHMLILSANEGNMPKSVNDASFIPHSVRYAYGLTTIENKTSIYAYYFHRMIQRAGDLTLTYNNASSDTKTCEMSRFMMQLLAESPLDIKTYTLTSPIVVGRSRKTSIDKKASVIEKMENMEYISPSAINNYLRCQLQFFYKNVCGIKDNDESDEEDLDKRVFGLIFHRTAELLYTPFKGKSINKSDIEAMLKDPSLIDRALEQAFKEELFLIKEEYTKKRKMPSLNGAQMINYRIIKKLIISLLKYDHECCPINIIDLEYRVFDTISFNTDEGIKTKKIKGIIDRLDSIVDSDGVKKVRVVDYKTGSKEAKATSVEAIFDDKEQKGNSNTEYFLQTMLYCKMLTQPESGAPKIPDMPVVPALLYPHRWTPDNNYNPILSIDKKAIEDIRNYSDDFSKGLKSVLSEIYDYSKPFKPTENVKDCENCYFYNICGKFE